MGADILAISGSPIPNSNTDRILKRILEISGGSGEFIKLSRIQVGPCRGCKRCVPDNICKVEDDFPALAEKLKAARAIILGAYTPYSQIDAFTKSLLERFWSLRHVTHLLKGKIGATVVTGLNPQTVETVSRAMAMEMSDYEGMNLLGQIRIQGNLPCVTCGRGDDCPQSAKPLLHGPDTPCSQIPYQDAETLEEIRDQADDLGKKIKAALA